MASGPITSRQLERENVEVVTDFLFWALKSLWMLTAAMKSEDDCFMAGKLLTNSAQSLQLCLTFCDPVDHSSPGSFVIGILQARIVEWVAMPSSRRSSSPRDQTCISCLAGRFFTADPPIS